MIEPAFVPTSPPVSGAVPNGLSLVMVPVAYELLIVPYVHACLGLERSIPMTLALREGRKKRTPLDEFFPVRVEGAPAMLTQIPLNTSGDIRLGIGANGLALHPSGSGDLGRGTEVRFYSFA